MESIKKKLIIVGGGLSGLTLGYKSSLKDREVTILEATNRLGGRIHTVDGDQQTPLDLGATWFSDQHPTLSKLVDELGLQKFPQFDTGTALFQTKSFEPPQQFEIPTSTVPSYRLAGGTSAIIQALTKKLSSEQIILNAPVHQIKESGNGIMAILADGKVISGDQAIICLPPQVAAANIEFFPSLSDPMKKILTEVQTWMAGSVKFALEYDQPFWRHEGYSGMLYSHSGAITEMYDHSNLEGNRFALCGFLNSGVQYYSPATRKQYVTDQLNTLFGKKTIEPLGYHDKIWNEPTILAGPQVFSSAHYNNGHPLLQKNYMNGKLCFAGSETSTTHPGYMEGAVSAALRVANQL